MTIRLLLLKSGEDIIADVSEMAVGERGSEESPHRVIGYYFKDPCVVKVSRDSVDAEKKPSLQVSLIKWMPLTDEPLIPVPADWVVTIVEPKEKLKEMFIEEVLENGKNNQDTSTNESTDSD